MTLEEVVGAIYVRWEHNAYISGFGFRVTELNPDPPPRNRNVIIGERSIRHNLGYYRIIFRTDVVAHWGFDENDVLIEVRVIKFRDVP